MIVSRHSGLRKSLLWATFATFWLTLSDYATTDAKPKIAFLLKTTQERRYQADRRELFGAAQKLGTQVLFNGRVDVPMFVTLVVHVTKDTIDLTVVTEDAHTRRRSMETRKSRVAQRVLWFGTSSFA